MLSLSQVVSGVATFIDSIPGVYQPEDDLETTIAELATNTVLLAAGALLVLTIIAMIINERVPKLKLPVFILMVIAMVGSTVTLIGSTVYLNVSSDSGGPVHWHADFEIWACGNELELRDPTGFLSNKIGTSTLHEHDDRRIHLEGVVVDEVIDASVGKFMHVVGGAITDQALVVPLNEDADLRFEEEVDGDGPTDANPSLIEPFILNDPELDVVASFEDGQTCGDEVSDVQVFVYNYNSDDKTYTQRKLDNPRDYVIFDDSNVPPGDCIIFEFGPTVEKTDKLCGQYGIRDIERCEEFGVEPNQRDICEIEQLDYDSSADYRVQTVEAVTELVIDESAEEATDENSELIAAPLHSDPVIERLRANCELSREGADAEPGELADTPECQEYDQALLDNPEAQAEVDASEAEVQGITTEEGVL